MRFQKGRATVAWAAVVLMAFMSELPVRAQNASAATAPAAVTKAFQASYPGAVFSATQERGNGNVVYRVNGVDKGGRRRVVLYDASARAIEVSEQVEEKDLPKPVADAMHSHPRAIYVSGLRVRRDGSVTYKLTVRGTRKTEMIAKADGTVLSFK